MAKPFLVYVMLDFTSSRANTREAMRPYEEKLSRLILESGGKHPVVCMGVAYKGDRCDEPRQLKTPQDVQNFLSQSPVPGRTAIEPALRHYERDPNKPVLSLGLLIGDTADGDNDENLVKLAKRLGAADGKRPVVVAYEHTGGSMSDSFCMSASFCRPETGLAHQIGAASGGFAFSLSGEPTQLVNFLEGYKRILSMPPQDIIAEMKSNSATVFPSLSKPARDMLARQAQSLLLENKK